MATDNRAYDAVMVTPFSSLGIRLQGESLCGIVFLHGDWKPRREAGRRVALVVSRIEDYLRDPATSMELPIRLRGTPFQQRVWQQLRCIPAGTAMTYGELAELLGSSPRAVGNACRANPCPVVIPCHRVVSATGIGGFAGQRVGEKLAVKRWLLAHEGYL